MNPGDPIPSHTQKLSLAAWVSIGLIVISAGVVLVANAKKYRILVVDDEPDIAAVMKLGLQKEGFEVEAITDPIKAIEYYQKSKRFDLALIDVRMSPINGFELYRRLLKIDNKLKVCFITAFEIYYDEFRRVFPKIKVDCFVRKPVTIESLVKLIRAELERIEADLELVKVDKKTN
jgi:two-component system, OmpR family, response regulator ChvI